jgi:hypothetical protein
MKYEINTEEDGRVVLKLGLVHSVSFSKDMDLEGIIRGVEMLIEATVGVSAFELVTAVMLEFGKITEDEAPKLKNKKEQVPGG